MHHLTITKQMIYHYFFVPSGKEFVCAGTREDCWADIKRGGKQIAFGKPIENATHVVLKPNLKKIQKCTHLDFLPETVTHLTIPIHLISLLDSEKLPNLQNIFVTYSYKNKELQLDLANITLDKKFNLHSFSFHANHKDYKNIWMDTAIDLTAYKNLEFVGLYIHDNPRDLKYLSSLTQVKYFEILSEKEDILAYIPRNAELIKLSCDEKKKNMDALSEFTQLQYLHINDLISEFDCKLLEKLPLKAIELWSVYKIINPLALLSIPTLQKVEILDHRRSLKKKDIELFQNHGFVEVNID